MTTRRRSPAAPSSTGSYESHFDHATLFEFSNVLNASLEMSFVLGHVLLTILGKLASSRGMALIAHPGGVFRVEMVKGFPQGIQGMEVRIPRPPSQLIQLNGRGAQKGRWTQFFRSHGAPVIIPLMIDRRPVGLLAFGPRLTRKPLADREITYLMSLANLASAAVEKVHMIGELQQVNRRLDRKVQELNTLFDLGKEFGLQLDPEKLVRLLVFSLLGQVGVTRYLVALRDHADMIVAASRLDGPAPQGELLTQLGQLKTAVRTEGIAVRRIVDHREALRACGISVVVPMQLQGRSRGVILLGEKLTGEPYSDGDLEFLVSLAHLAIISLENARLFRDAIEKQKLEDELVIAREIQKGLLPSVLPRVPRFTLAATNISSKQVGGDYYDVICTEAGPCVIAIGDVSGKGTPAALLMANLQATIRALVPLNRPLSELTGRVNDLMCQNTGGNKFITFFWGWLDSSRLTLTYVNAGHNPPYLVRSSGTIERLDRGGMILGVLPTTVPYEQGNVDLAPGDMIVLFTDGVSEAMSRVGEEYGEERLEAVLQARRTDPPSAVLEAIHSDVLRHTSGAAQSDDLTLMVVRVLPGD